MRFYFEFSPLCGEWEYFIAYIWFFRCSSMATVGERHCSYQYAACRGNAQFCRDVFRALWVVPVLASQWIVHGPQFVSRMMYSIVAPIYFWSLTTNRSHSVVPNALYAVSSECGTSAKLSSVLYYVLTFFRMGPTVTVQHFIATGFSKKSFWAFEQTRSVRSSTCLKTMFRHAMCFNTSHV